MRTTSNIFLLFSVIFLILPQWAVSDMPLPFTRELSLQSPPMEGDDVTIFQNLVVRDAAVKSSGAAGVYDETAAQATANFQSAHELEPTGVLDADTANKLLSICSNDGNYNILNLESVNPI
jgi:peptidoglycan hydrolase-like protein with peptidoglycan-binding domain